MPGRSAAKAAPKGKHGPKPKPKPKEPVKQKHTKTTTEKIDRPDLVTGELRRGVCLVTPPDREAPSAPDPKMEAYWDKVLKRKKPDTVESSMADDGSSMTGASSSTGPVPGPLASNAAVAVPSTTLLPFDAGAEPELPAAVMISTKDANAGSLEAVLPSSTSAPTNAPAVDELMGARSSGGNTDTNVNCKPDDPDEKVIDGLSEGEMLAALEEALNVPCDENDDDDGPSQGLRC